MKTVLLNLILIALNGLLSQSVMAAQVTYWFSGHVSHVDNPSNALPFSVTVGAPFAGRVSYDTSRVFTADVDSYPDGDTGLYYFNDLAGLSMALQIAGHTITNGVDSADFSGLVGLYDQFGNGDTYMLESSKRLFIDGTSFLSAPYYSMFSLFLADNSKTAINSVALPTNAPVLTNFANSQEFLWGAYRDDGGPTKLFSVEGVVTRISSSEQALLNCHRSSPSSIQLAWPAFLAGFNLQSTTNLVSGNWQSVTNPAVDINGERTVTVEPTGATRFFRLKK